MKKIIIPVLSILPIELVFNLSSCKKDSADTFCSTNRTSISTLDLKTAIVLYYQKYNRYGIRIDTSLTGNIDSQVICPAFDIPKELGTEGMNVTVSGEL